MKKTFNQTLGNLLLLGALEGLACLVWLFLIPADGKNSLLWGFSSQRILLMFIVLVGAVLTAGLGWFLRLNKFGSSGGLNRIKFWLTHPFFGIFLFFLAFSLINILLIPDYLWEKNIYLFERLRPLLIWVTLFVTQGLLALSVNRFRSNNFNFYDIWRSNKRLIIITFAVFGFLLLIWGWMNWSGMGIVPDISFWNDPGVPLMIFQVFICLLAGGCFYLCEPHLLKKHSKLWDGVICLILFITAALIWNFTQQTASYFAPGPYPPAGEFYPFSDAANYDISAQMAALGQGYYSTFACPDKPLYLMFLTWLHLAAGDHFPVVVVLQTICYAVLPVLLYLLGSNLGLRSIGLMAALLSTFKESNAINSATLISTSNTRMIMSEVPTAILLASFTLVLIHWTKSKNKPVFLAGVLGGINGLATLLRLNTFIFLPVSLVIITLVLFKDWKKLLFSGLAFVIFFLASVSPWVIRSQVVCHVNPFYYFTGPLNGVVVGTRFNLSENSAVEPQINDPLATTSPVVPQESLTPTTPEPAVEGSPVYQDAPNEKQSSHIIKPAGMGLVNNVFAWLGPFGDKVQFIFNHFFHNLLSTVLILPTTWLHDSLPVISAPSGTFWADDWDGGVSFSSGLLIAVNLFVIALGLSLAWKNYKLAGLMPLLVYLVYNFGLAVARTSGGRYIVSAEWVIFVYFAAGLAVLITWLLRLLAVERKPGSAQVLLPASAGWKYLIGSFFVVLLIGGLIPITEKIIPARLFPNPPMSTWVEAARSGGYDPADVQNLVSLGCEIQSGKAAFPRFFYFGQSIPSGVKENQRIYPRIVFSLLTSDRKVIRVVLPATQIPYDLLNGNTVSVLGCFSSDQYLEALMILNGQQVIYRDPPAAELKCPLPEIKCNDNHVCR
ncbi:MAG: hypothetical protein LWX83_04435 [Anaerolineae bacterium]|nr:hypothetical protein [Anaerolineae bacterium]